MRFGNSANLCPPEDSYAAYSGNIRLRLPRSLHARLDALAREEGVSNRLMVAFLAEWTGYRSAERLAAPGALLVAREPTRRPVAKRRRSAEGSIDVPQSEQSAAKRRTTNH